MLKLKLNTLATWYKELTHLKRPWCWERLKVGEEGDDRGWDGWMASPTQWTLVWVKSGSWWWTGRPGVLPSMGSQRAGHDWASWAELYLEQCPAHKYYLSASLSFVVVISITSLWVCPCKSKQFDLLKHQWSSKYDLLGRFPGSPVVRTLCFHWVDPSFSLWSGN